MKAAAGMIGIGLFLLFLGGIMWALGNFRGVGFTGPHIIATDAETSVNIVLANEVVDNATTNITVVSSNSDDAPVPYLYTSVNRQLTINGLNPSDTRTLTVTYKVPRLDDFTDFAARFMPTVLIIGSIMAAIGIVIAAFRHG